MAAPAFKYEPTGNVALDRIQDGIRRAFAFLATLDARPEVISIVTEAPFTTTATTPQSTRLTFPVRAGDYWVIEYHGFAGNSNVAGMKYAVAAPTDTAIDGVLDTTLTSSTDDTHVRIQTVNSPTIAVHTVAGGTRSDHLIARLAVVKDGAVTLQVCSTNAGTTTTLDARAYLRATRYRRV